MSTQIQHNDLPGSDVAKDNAAGPSPQSGPHREPSQQDLEIARQLQSFQSQGTSVHKQDRDGDTQSHSSREAYEAVDPAEGAGAGGRSYAPTQHHTDHSSPADIPAQEVMSTETVGSGQICTNCGTTKTPLWRRSPHGAVICNACGLYFKARNQMRPVGMKRAVGALASPQRLPGQSHERSTSPAALQGGTTYVSADQSTNGTCPGGGRCNGTGGHEGCNGCPAYNNRISKAAQVALRQALDASEGVLNAIEHQNNQPAPQTVVVACQNCETTITPLWRRDEAGNAICNACGLYYKLHGQHRPVQMKKAEIKRRKRVVPANMSDGHLYSYSNEAAEISTQITGPTPSHNTHPFHTMEPRTAAGPIPVDFTDAFRSRQPQMDSHEHNTSSKRSYSATESDMEPYPHAQNVGFLAINAIDPTLPMREPAVSSKEARRAELQRETDRMRHMLQEKERELAALGDEN